MNTKLAMIATAVTLGILGLEMTSAPGEVVNFMEVMALGKSIISISKLPILIWVLGGFHILFTALFWIITFTDPLKGKGQ